MSCKASTGKIGCSCDLRLLEFAGVREWDLQEIPGGAGQKFCDLLPSQENWAVLWIQKFGVWCRRVESPGDSHKSKANPLGYIVLPGKPGFPIFWGSWCLILGNWISRRCLEKQAEPLGCFVQPGKLGCPWNQTFSTGERDLQRIPRGAGQTPWDVFSFLGAHFSQNFTTQKEGSGKTLNLRGWIPSFLLPCAPF